MRLFEDCSAMLNEVARDLQEMGVVRQTQTMQDKDISGNSDFDTKELFNYSFCISQPYLDLGRLFQIPSNDFTRAEVERWANLEFIERTSHTHFNPGLAWKIRRALWEPFLDQNKKFSYTYNERLRSQYEAIINTFRKDPNTRQAILTIWNKMDVFKTGKKRVPCSLHYHFLASTESGERRLNVIYTMRSSDFVTHFANDVWLACKLLWWMSEQVGINPGKFYMNVASLHVYNKDAELLDRFVKGETNE